jgi:RNA-directed DNA polymerase
VNTDEPDQVLLHAERRVLEIQTKLHRWASYDPDRRFDDLYNLVADPAFLLVAWDRVRGNKGARTAGVDGETAHYIEAVRGLQGLCASCGMISRPAGSSPYRCSDARFPRRAASCATWASRLSVTGWPRPA